MAGVETDVKVIVSAIDNASNVLNDIGKNIEKTLSKQTQQSASDVNGVMAGLTGTFGKLAASVAPVGIAIAGIGATILGASAAFKPLLQAAGDAQRIMAQTNAVLSSTGGISGMTAQSVTKLAEEIAKTTPVQDEAVQSAENMLLRYTSIGKDVFPTATKALVDMTIGMNSGVIPSEQELVSMAEQLGKALQNPAEGMTLLRREGIVLTDAQKELITQLQNTGEGAKAQGVILDALQEKFGGSGAAAMNTYLGSQQNLENETHKLKVEMGDVLLPAATMLNQVFSGMLSSAIQFVASHMQALQGWCIALAGAFNTDIQAALGLIVTLAQLGSGNVSAGINSLNSTISGVKDNITKTQQAIRDATETSLRSQLAEAQTDYNGMAVAATSAGAKIQKSIDDENYSFNQAMQKRTESYQQSLQDMIFAHIDKRDAIIKDLQKENDQYAETLDERTQNFKDQMDSIVEDHAAKLKDLNAQLADEQSSFSDNMEQRKEDFQSTMSDMSDAHEQKVNDIEKQLDREKSLGIRADQNRLSDLQEIGRASCRERV
jgi:hypothetical protein